MIVGIRMQQQPPNALSQAEEHNKGDKSEQIAASPVVMPDGAGFMDPALMQHPAAAMNGGIGHTAHMYVPGPSASGAPFHPAMLSGLEQQFGHLAMHEHQAYHHTNIPQVGASNASNHDSSDNNTPSEEINGEEGDDSDDDPLKLFVGQIPKSMNEEDIFPTFDSFGPLKDVAIIRDRHSGAHRGCAFVTYWSAVDAERAREALHDKFTFPGAKRAAQVKPAEPSAASENKLFIGMLPREAGEEEVRELFSQFGEIREVYMIRNNDGSSKCAAFLRFTNRESAVQAIEKLNGNEVMEGSARPLIVKFADNKFQRQQRHVRNIRRQEMMTAVMVGPGGYPAYPPPPHGPPMGMPPSGSGPQYPMPPTPHQYGSAAAYGPGIGSAQAPPPHHAPYIYPAYPPYGYASRPEIRPVNPRPREGPAGANLFVYHLPHDLTDADLATAFNPFGNVISAKVYVDKYTGESKGFGFVSYDSVLSAEQAIEQMNGFQIGNKRLKVQHKRVHGSSRATSDHPGQQASSPSSGNSVNDPEIA